MKRDEFLRIGLIAAAMFVAAGGVAARTVAECFAENGARAPRPQGSSVVLLDGTTALTVAQRQQARELLLSELRPGRALTVYGFARGPGQESLQRLLHFERPAPLDDGWHVGAGVMKKVNACVAETTGPFMAGAAAALDGALAGYVPAPEGESPVAQAISAVVMAHPVASRFYFITDGRQYERAGFSVYDQQARGTQTLRRIEIKTDVPTLLRLATPPMTKRMSVWMFPVGQPEPPADGQAVRGRPARETTALIELWQVYFLAVPAGSVSVTSFVPLPSGDL